MTAQERVATEADAHGWTILDRNRRFLALERVVSDDTWEVLVVWTDRRGDFDHATRWLCNLAGAPLPAADFDLLPDVLATLDAPAAAEVKR